VRLAQHSDKITANIDDIGLDGQIHRITAKMTNDDLADGIDEEGVYDLEGARGRSDNYGFEALDYALRPEKAKS
jgi:hypothetical protein